MNQKLILFGNHVLETCFCNIQAHVHCQIVEGHVVNYVRTN